MHFGPLQSFKVLPNHFSLYGNSIEYLQLILIILSKAILSLLLFQTTLFQQNPYIFIIIIMPIEVSPNVFKWLKELKLISGEQIRQDGMYELAYNDQLYFQNGYLISQLLKTVLRKSGHRGEGLLRIRKIAHISSNQNWRILIEILREIGYDDEIDPHSIQSKDIESILQFLNDKFGYTVTPLKKLKRTHIDLNYFNSQRPLQSAQNLLEFLVIALKEAFEVDVRQAVGLLVQNGKYMRQILYFGTNQGHQPVMRLYQNILRAIPTFNRLLSEEYGGEQKVLSVLGLGVLSQNQNVCKLCCILLDSIDSDWPQQKGIDILIRSPHSQALDLLFRRLGPKMATILNNNLKTIFQGKIKIELKAYTNLLKYFSHSLFGKQALICLPITYYVSTAFDLFEPEQKINYGVHDRIAARILLSTSTKYYQKILGINERNQVLYCFDSNLTQTEQQRYTTLCIIFELISDLLQKQKQFSFKLFNAMWKYYTKGTINVRTFILSNLLFIFKVKPLSFPISLFLSLYEPSEILQPNEFQLLLALSNIKDLSLANGQLLLKISTIYYYQQLCAGGTIQIIKNIIKNQPQINWANQISHQILNKWPTLQIPPYHALPTQSKKIKYRSVGLKKKEMILFTELNRYKNMLYALTQVSDRIFLTSYAKAITQTMHKVQKSKVKQMQNTKLWFDRLLAVIDQKLLQIKDTQRYVASSLDSNSIMSEISMQDSIDYNTQSPASRMGSVIEEQNNEFMPSPKKEQYSFTHQQKQKSQASPLLPFSQDQVQHTPVLSQQIYFENYEHIFVKNIYQKYQSMLQNLALDYKSSLNLEYFFQSIQIKSYVQHRIPQILQLQKSLNLSEDSPIKKIYKIFIQSAFYAFQFKSNRRVSINCVESFMKLIADKNQKDSNTDKGAKIETKMQFQHQITNLLRKNNSNQQKYFICFQILSQMLTNVGLPLVEPISKIVTKIGEKTTQNQINLIQQQKIDENDLKELELLEKIIESEPSSSKKVESKTSSKFFKKKDIKYQDTQIDKSKLITERWAQVQKKVIMRRRELEGKVQPSQQ